MLKEKLMPRSKLSPAQKKVRAKIAAAKYKNSLKGQTYYRTRRESEHGKQKQREAMARFLATPKGQEYKHRLNHSLAQREAVRRYDMSPKGQEKLYRYAHSPRGREAKRDYYFNVQKEQRHGAPSQNHR